jgi:tetratricopeptide (TPR) repeat protein
MRLQGLSPVILVLALAISRPCFCEDTVTVLSGKDNKIRTNRTGEVVEYTGETLQLKSASGRVENIPAARVADIRTQWTPAHERGDALRAEGKLEEAVAAYKQAKREETRVWGRRKIMSELVTCYGELGSFELAGAEWLTIVASDPSTMFFSVIPVAYRSLPPSVDLETRAAAWMNSKEPAAQVLGASWLLTSPQRNAAVEALERLVATKSVDPRVRSLAQIQLWRTKLVTAKLDEVQRWQAAALRMPADVQAGGYFVVGDALARLNQPADAALAYLRIPVVHPEQRAMAADALLEAGKLHEKLKRGEQAFGLYREVLSGYSRTAAAEEAKARLGIK